MKKIWIVLSVLMLTLVLSACHEHSWKEADCVNPKTCESCGATEGEAKGHNYSRGYCIRCDIKDPDYIEYGTVQGTITYKYNDYVGHRGDNGAVVLLFPGMSDYDTKNYDNSHACLGLPGIYDSGIMVAKCDGNGNYRFDNVPVGRYYIFIISEETTSGDAFDDKAGRDRWIKNNFASLLSEEDIKTLISLVGYQKTTAENFDVIADRTSTISYDFGITYI